MSDTQIQHTAEYLASHALVLLGLGIVSAVGSLVAIAVLVQVLRIAPLRRLAASARTVIPLGPLALHLTLGLTVTAAVAIFVILAENIAAGRALATFDVAFARALREATTPGWERTFIFVSWLGSGPVLTVATALAAVGLWKTNRSLLAAWWIGAQAGGGILILILKGTFERSRPEFANPLHLPSSWSFPSGHVMATFIFCALASYVLLRGARSWLAASIILVVSVSWCLVMSFSRLYLGVHFVGDVLAGLVAGAAWIAVCVSGLELHQQRRGTARSAASRAA
jgi:membrane-associated phospholipid phosphatase